MIPRTATRPLVPNQGNAVPSAVPPVARHKENIIGKAADFLHERTGARLSHNQARQAVENIAKVFLLLDDWDRKASLRQPNTVNDEEIPPSTDPAQPGCHGKTGNLPVGTKARVRHRRKTGDLSA